MKPALRFGLTLAGLFGGLLAVVACVFFIFATDLAPQQRAVFNELLAQRAPPLGLLAMLALLGLGIALKKLFERYLVPLSRLAEDVVLLAANPAHRAAAQGAPDVRMLADKFNILAASHQALQQDVAAKVEQAGRALAEEKNRLAALMSELAQSVLVCNLEGRILLYNTRATQLLETTHDAAGTNIGLGRSVFGVIERGLIVHALEQIQHQRQRGGEAPPPSGAGAEAEAEAEAATGADFVTMLVNGHLVRAHMVPVLDSAAALNGFVLTLEDITRNVETTSRRDALLHSLTQDTRAALANIRAAVETIQQFPEMDHAKRQQFTAIIDDESQRLSQQIDRAEQGQSEHPGSRWQLEDMRGADLIALLKRRIETPAVRIGAADTTDATLWLKLDSYALTQALAYLVQCIAGQSDVAAFDLNLRRAERLAHLDLGWSGAALPLETLQEWENTALPFGDGKYLQTLSAVIKGLDGESVYLFNPAQQRSCYRLLLPLAQPQAALEIRLKQAGRPEFYDFDLFHQSGQTDALDQGLLSRLSYTVFDTETTGLAPAAGDEIVSIGALRIVNGRLLAQENFDQLVQPGRKLSAESIAIHGINDAMLSGQPTIETILPQFHRFAQDTVLVAHNAAFDMRFLQMKEDKTGIRFTQPVLDTLLLSQVIHPHQEQHSLEAIARRLGVDIVGRHTALGDAIVTAEVFLKMLPLLAEKGIVTLRDAREAEQQTAYARIRY
jgi:DNA polymerase III subunit epsilon